jgi:hypothetical protein
VQVAEVRLRAGDQFPVRADQDAHHAVRGGMLRAHVDLEVGGGDVEHELALARGQRALLFGKRHRSA